MKFKRRTIKYQSSVRNSYDYARPESLEGNAHHHPLAGREHEHDGGKRPHEHASDKKYHPQQLESE